MVDNINKQYQPMAILHLPKTVNSFFINWKCINSYKTDAGVHVCFINKLWRKLNGKSKMENPETLPPLGTQDTGPQKHNIKHIIRFI
jgi:hypothetical protein